MRPRYWRPKRQDSGGGGYVDKDGRRQKAPAVVVISAWG
jgi:hypothetical protein